MKLEFKILNVADDTPVPGVSVSILNADGTGTGQGTLSDANGNVLVDSKLLDIPGAKLSITHTSFSPTTIRPSGVTSPFYIATKADQLGSVTAVIKNNSGLTAIVFIALLIGAAYYILKMKK